MEVGSIDNIFNFIIFDFAKFFESIDFLRVRCHLCQLLVCLLLTLYGNLRNFFLQFMNKLNQILNFLRRVRSRLWVFYRLLNLFFRFFDGLSLNIYVDLCSQPSPLEACESIIVDLGEVSEGTEGCTCYLHNRLVYLINEGLNFFLILKVVQVLQTFVEFLEFNKLRNFLQYLLKILRSRQGVKFLHCFRDYLVHFFKFHNILGYIVTRSKNRKVFLKQIFIVKVLNERMILRILLFDDLIKLRSILDKNLPLVHPRLYLFSNLYFLMHVFVVNHRTVIAEKYLFVIWTCFHIAIEEGYRPSTTGAFLVE